MFVNFSSSSPSSKIIVFKLLHSFIDEGSIDFKRVQLVPGTGKFQYRDTHFVARVKASSGQECYDRIVDHLSQRVDSRSQFPSAKGKNFKFLYLGLCK